MNKLAHSFSERYKLPAGILTLAVHGAFFALLYFGVNWQSVLPEGMMVDIWGSLSAQQPGPAKGAPTSAAQAQPPKAVKPHKTTKPVEPSSADIELAEKTELEIKPPETMKPMEIQPAQTATGGPVQQGQVAQGGQSGPGSGNGNGKQGAADNVVDEYRLRIIAKIRSNIVMPPAVPDSLRAEFNVILAPDGSVQSARLVKTSGSAVYDHAVERAIAKAQPLPLPPDVSLFDRFRELHLLFRPKD